MRIRFAALAVALAGFAALSAPASAAALSPSSDGRIVVAQGYEGRMGERDMGGRDRDMRRGDRDHMGERHMDRHMDRRMMHRGPERCRVTIIRERTRHGMVERRIRRCR
jgi:hypothetical protein